ncbi:hypothetical protein CO615_10590, partial [Lysobacteraceae bacterium NML75-0749]
MEATKETNVVTNMVTNHEEFDIIGDVNAKCILLAPNGERIEVNLSHAKVVYTACKHVNLDKLKGALNAPLPEKVSAAARQVLICGEIHNAIIAPEWREAVAKLIHHHVVKAHWGNIYNEWRFTRRAELPSAIVLMALVLGTYHGSNIHNTPRA